MEGSVKQLALIGEGMELPGPASRKKIKEALEELPPDDPRLEVIQDPTRFLEFMGDLRRQDLVAFDTETSGLRWQDSHICGFCFGFGGKGYYLPTKHLDGKNLSAEVWRKPLIEWFLDAGRRGVTLVMHHAKFDIHMVETEFGLRLPDLGFVIHDTMIQAHLIRNDGPKALKMLAERIEKGAGKWEEAVDTYRRKHKVTREGYDVVPVSILGPYAAADTLWTAMLHEKQYPTIQENFADLYDIEIRFSHLLQRMERIGVWCDLAYFRELEPALKERITETERQVQELAGRAVDLGSNRDLSKLLFSELKLPVKKFTEKGNAALDHEALSAMEHLHPIIQPIKEYRDLTKKLTTYVENAIKYADENDRIHTTFNQTGTATGRLSSSEPNLQNISKDDEIRRGYGPDREQGYIWALIDYSQIEARLFAHYSKDPTLIEAFHSGQDPYKATAVRIYGVGYDEVTKDMRDKAKKVVLGIQYGMGEGTLAAQLGMSRSEARDFLNTYYAAFPTVPEMQRLVRTAIRGRGYVFNAFGRRAYVDREKTYRGVNYLIQGLASDILRVAMLRCDDLLRARNAQSRLILTIHDELIFEIKRGEEDLIPELAAAMSAFDQFRVPIDVEVSVTETTWADKRTIAM